MDTRKWMFAPFPPYSKIVQDRAEEIDHQELGWRDNPFTDEEIKAYADAEKKKANELSLGPYPPIEVKDPVIVDLEFTEEELLGPVKEKLAEIHQPEAFQATADQVDKEAAEFARQSVLETLPTKPIEDAGKAIAEAIDKAPVQEQAVPVAPVQVDSAKTDWSKLSKKDAKKAEALI